MEGTDPPDAAADADLSRPVNRVRVFLDHTTNQRLLMEWLADLDRYEVEDSTATLDDSVDLCIVDRTSLETHRPALTAWASASEEVFSPCLLVCEEGEVVDFEPERSIIHDVVVLPVGRAQLERRIRQLLLQREQSLELHAARQTLAEQNERLQTFANRLAHDLRNPLGIVSGHVDQVRETHPNDIRSFAAIERGLDRMQRLIDETLTLARMGQAAIDSEPVSLRRAAERGWEHVETGDATLAVTEDERFSADETRLQALFENLYRNAIEHVGSDVAVEVGPLDDGFYVADNGPGIPADDREMVFEVGYTTNEDGTGFGLRIVQEIAAAHGWAVDIAESERGGTRFEFTGCEPA